MTRPHSLTATLPLLLAACGPGADAPSSGEAVVRNTADPIWTAETAWRVVEELRIGEAMNEGPDLFGSVLSFDVDARGRIYVLDDHAQEVRVFDAEGAFVRTVGGKGEGPGEFVQAGAVDVARNGEIWVMGMSLGRVSIFDSAGTYLRGERTNAGGRIMKPYPGGFDPMGRYNVVTPPAVTRGMARFDQSFNPIDIIPLPEDPVEGEYFERLNEDGVATMSASVPFQGFMTWRFSPTGTVWMLLTGRYELIETTTGGEVLRRVTKDHEPIPVTAEERERAIEDLDWFTSQGGVIDRSKIPGSKPSTASFFIDDEGNLWVEQQVAADDADDAGRVFDVFDGGGRFLGTVRLPFSLEWSRPEPIVREGVIWGVTRDGVGAEYVVRGRVVKG